jgi:hypothetical protein
MLNYGDTEEAPEIRFLEEEEAGLIEAQRDEVLSRAGLEIGVDFLRKKYGIPEPAEGEETIGGQQAQMLDAFGNPKGSGGGGGQDAQSVEDQTQQSEDQATQGKGIAAAGDLPGHQFHGNQYTTIAQHEYIPAKDIRKVKPTIWRTWPIEQDATSTTPVIRREPDGDLWAWRSSDSRNVYIYKVRIKVANNLAAKLKQLNAIEDDAVFSRELCKLAGVTHQPVATPPIILPKPQPQIINLHVEGNQSASKTFTIKRSDGTVVEGEISQTVETKS